MSRTENAATESVTAFFAIRDGKASTMTEIAHFEGLQLKLDNH